MTRGLARDRWFPGNHQSAMTPLARYKRRGGWQASLSKPTQPTHTTTTQPNPIHSGPMAKTITKLNPKRAAAAAAAAAAEAEKRPHPHALRKRAPSTRVFKTSAVYHLLSPEQRRRVHARMLERAPQAALVSVAAWASRLSTTPDALLEAAAAGDAASAADALLRMGQPFLPPA